MTKITIAGQEVGAKRKSAKLGRPCKPNAHGGRGLKQLVLNDNPHVKAADFDKAIGYAARLFKSVSANQLEFLLCFGLSRKGIAATMAQAACDTLGIMPTAAAIQAATHGRMPQAVGDTLTQQHKAAIQAALDVTRYGLSLNEWLYATNDNTTRAYVDFNDSYAAHYPINWIAATDSKARNAETAALAAYGGRLPHIGRLATATTPAHAEQLAAAVSDFNAALWWVSYEKQGRLYGYQMAMRRQRQARQDTTQAAIIDSNTALAYKLLSMDTRTIHAAFKQLDAPQNAVAFARDMVTMTYHTDYTRRGLRLYKAGLHIATAIDDTTAMYCLAALQAHDYNTRFEYLQTVVNQYLDNRAKSLA